MAAAPFPPLHSESSLSQPPKGSHAVENLSTGRQGGAARSRQPRRPLHLQGGRCEELVRSVRAVLLPASLVTKCISIPVKSVYHNVLETVLFVLYCLNN